MGFETYLIENINQMNALLIKSGSDSEQSGNYLLEAAVVGCRTLNQLSDDPELGPTLDQFADVRIITAFIQKASSKESRRRRLLVQQFRSIVENDENFETFLDMEREVLIRGGLPIQLVDALIENSSESVAAVKSNAKPPSEVLETIRLLRDRACLLSDDLITEAKDKERWESIKERIKRIMLGIGGAALIGLNASSLAGSVGITTAGSAVSAAFGATIIRSAGAGKSKAIGR